MRTAARSDLFSAAKTHGNLLGGRPAAGRGTERFPTRECATRLSISQVVEGNLRFGLLLERDGALDGGVGLDVGHGLELVVDQADAPFAVQDPELPARGEADGGGIWLVACHRLVYTHVRGN